MISVEPDQVEQLQRLIQLYNSGETFREEDRRLFDKLMLVPGGREMFVASSRTEAERRVAEFEQRRSAWLSTQEAREVRAVLSKHYSDETKVEQALREISAQGASSMGRDGQSPVGAARLVQLHLGAPQADLVTLLQFAEIVKGIDDEEGQP